MGNTKRFSIAVYGFDGMQICDSLTGYIIRTPTYKQSVRYAERAAYADFVVRALNREHELEQQQPVPST